MNRKTISIFLVTAGFSLGLVLVLALLFMFLFLVLVHLGFGFGLGCLFISLSHVGQSHQVRKRGHCKNNAKVQA